MSELFKGSYVIMGYFLEGHEEMCIFMGYSTYFVDVLRNFLSFFDNLIICT